MKKIKIFIKCIIAIILIIIAIVFIKDKIKYGIIESRITDVSELKRDTSSYHYVNDLYISDGRLYEYMLDSKEQKIYKNLYDAILNREKKISLDMSEFDYSKKDAKSVIETEMEKILEALSMDHPELIYYSPSLNTFEYKSDSNLIDYELDYSMSEKEYQKNIELIQSTIEDIKTKTKSMTDFEKVRYVYKWICDNNVFGEEMGELSHSAYSAFVSEEPVVCESMAKASQIIFQNIGINSIIVIGKRIDVNHEWNAVKLDGKWYYFDSTMGLSGKNSVSDQVVNYEYFLFKENDNYIVTYDTLLPKINGNKYIKEDGMYF